MIISTHQEQDIFGNSFCYLMITKISRNCTYYGETKHQHLLCHNCCIDAGRNNVFVFHLLSIQSTIAIITKYFPKLPHSPENFTIMTLIKNFFGNWYCHKNGKQLSIAYAENQYYFAAQVTVQHLTSASLSASALTMMIL